MNLVSSSFFFSGNKNKQGNKYDDALDFYVGYDIIHVKTSNSAQITNFGQNGQSVLLPLIGSSCNHMSGIFLPMTYLMESVSLIDINITWCIRVIFTTSIISPFANSEYVKGHGR